MATKKKKKQVKKPKPKDAGKAESHPTDQNARGHSGQYGKKAIGAGMKGNITKANKGSTGSRGR